jgi:flagellar capping protein FliD
MDTDAIIEKLLSVEQAKIDSLGEEKEINNTKIATWQELAEMMQEMGSVTKQLKADITTSLYSNKSVSSTYPAIATATASSGALATSYELNITNIAKQAVAYGSSKAAGWTLPTGGTVVINGATITLTSGDSLEDIAAKINAGSFTSGYEVTAMVIGEAMVLQTNNTGSAQTIHGTTSGNPPFVTGTDDPDDILRDELGLINGGGNLSNSAQTGLDAAFTLNGIPITNAKNSINDVIENVTLQLNSTGITMLGVQHDTEEIKEKIQEFINLYNDIRTYVDNVRNATLDEEEFGMFFSDSMMRDVYNDLRRLSTGGVAMGGADWAGSVTVKTAASANATTLTLENFTAATGSLQAGDMFTIAGDTTVYRLTSNASIAGNEATIGISPPLAIAVTGTEAITLATRTLDDFGIGVRTDNFLSTDGVLGITDEGLLDSTLASDLDLIRYIFSRSGDGQGQQGVATRLWDWIDTYTQVSTETSATKKRLIDHVRVTNLNTANDDLDKQIKRLQERMGAREELLVRQYAELENAIARSQAAGQAVMSLSGQQNQQQ